MRRCRRAAPERFFLIRFLLRRPILTTAAVAGVLAASGAGYAASTSGPDASAEAAFALDASAVKASRQQSRAADVGRAFQQEAAQRAEADRAARLEAQRKAEAEAARQAQLAAEREAARKAEAERQAQLEAERRAAAEQASRSAARDPKGAARAMLGDYGWSSGQFSCLEALWERESGWDPSATNASSGAYGIPQALPGSKMASAGGDWRTNPVTQIRWGLGYIQGTYGSPCGALDHSDANGWY